MPETGTATREAAAYLWAIYSVQGFGGGAGISAMPSLHIATTAWIVMAIYIFARRWLAPVAGAAILIFLLSISLGWHYAVDGVVGAVLTIVIYSTVGRAYDRLGASKRTIPFAAVPPTA